MRALPPWGLMIDADSQYREALALHQSGDLEAAHSAYLALLKDFPDHARSLHRLGNLDLRSGRFADAERLIRRAIELEPDGAGFYNSLGNVLRAAGRTEEALAAYAEELRRRPDFAVAHHQLGLLLLETGQTDAALRAVQKAIYHAADFGAAYSTLGRIFNNLGRLEEAEQALTRARHFDPANAGTHFNYGHVARRKGDLQAAIDSFRRALKIDPKMQPAQRNLGMTLLAAGHSQEAIEPFEQALALNPRDPVAHFGLGVIFQERAMLEPAKRHFSEAVKLKADYADAHCNLAATHRSLGEFGPAKTHFRQALAAEAGHRAALSGLAAVLEMEGAYDEAYELLDPHVSHGEAHPDILVVYATVLERLERRDDAIATLERHLGRSAPDTLDRAVLNFKLGDLRDHAGHYEQALTHFDAGNALRSTGFDPANHRSVAQRIIAAYSPEAMDRLPRSGNESEVPLFIVGMPRSGTSLVEQILASHPAAHGAGELATIGLMALGLPRRIPGEAPYPECMAEASAEILADLAGRYLDQVNRLAPEAARVTDKMWQNYENIGLISLLFPRARIVHCLRDPRDVLLSCYFHLFGAGGIPFSYDPAHLVTAWNAYRDLMQHWREVCPLPILEVDYETLASNPDEQIPRLIEFAGLPWDDACLRFHETRRAVTTASYHQVTQPMYTRSIGRYRNYADWADKHFGELRKF